MLRPNHTVPVLNHKPQKTMLSKQLTNEARQQQKARLQAEKKAAKRAAQESRKAAEIMHWTGFSSPVAALVLEFAAFQGKLTDDDTTLDDVINAIQPLQEVEITLKDVAVMHEPTHLVLDPQDSNQALFVVFSPLTVKDPNNRAKFYFLKQGLADELETDQNRDVLVDGCLLLPDSCTTFSRSGAMQMRCGQRHCYFLRRKV